VENARDLAARPECSHRPCRQTATASASPNAFVRQELFTLAETAAILSPSERTIEALVARGHLRSAIAPGTDRARRISRAMIEEYIDRFNGLCQHGCSSKRLS
jgi:excisionase family DNA binding protein